MKTRMLLLLVAGIAGTGFGATSGQEEKSDVDKLKGAWVCAPEKGVVVSLTFGEGKATMTVESAEKKSKLLTYKLDPAKNPKQIDLIETGGPRKGETTPAIYLLDGDMLKICFPGRPVAAAPDPKEPKMIRPTEFKAINGQEIMIFKRQKP